MTLDRRIEKVAIAGGGLTGWSTAAALKRRIPSLEVAIISTPPAADAIVDRAISTLPSIFDFHSDIGLTEADTIVRAQSCLRAGTIFEGWAAGTAPYVHAYGNYGQPVESTAFHQQWLRARAVGDVDPFDRFSPAAELGRAGRIPRRDSKSSATAQRIGYGLQLTPDRYLQLMRAYALHLGVADAEGELSNVELNGESGFVERLQLMDGRLVNADLFVDCTGPAAEIRSRLASDFCSWSRWLPCDRIIFATGAPDSSVQLVDEVIAAPWGWTWRSSSPAISSIGAAYSSAFAKKEEVTSQLPPDYRATAYEVHIEQGRWLEPWVHNCVAIGDSAVALEPLEWTNLHLVHSQIDRLVSMMAGCECASVELAEYNRQCGAEADRIRDFLCMHYALALRDEPFWKEVPNAELPDTLAHTLSLYGERGRLPYYEEETFTRDNWLAVLLGQGFVPRRIDPLAEIISVEDALRAIAKCRQAVKTFVESQPSYRDSLSSLGQHA